MYQIFERESAFYEALWRGWRTGYCMMRNRWPDECVYAARCLVTLMSPVIAACTGDDLPSWQGSIDTLPSGIVHVSNPKQGLWGDDSPWRLVEVARIGTQLDSGPEVFGEIRDFDVDGLGRVYIFDWQAQDVRLFEADGSYIRTIGRQGGGPGEFSNVNGIAVDSADLLWVHNQGNMRYSVFDTNGALVMEPRATVTNVLFGHWLSVFSNDGQLMEYGGYRTEEGHFSGVQRYDLATERLVDVDVSLAGPPPPGFRPFSVTFTLTPRGRWVGDRYEYRLAHLGFDGDTVRTVERSRSPDRLSVAERDSAKMQERDFKRRATQRGIDFETELRPIFDRILVDDLDHIWLVLTPGPEDNISRFDVLDPLGRYLGEVAAPHVVEQWPLPLCRDGRVYYVSKDELDVQYVVVAEIRGRT